MVETLDMPAVIMFSKLVSQAGTDATVSTGMTNAIDVRSVIGLAVQVPQLARKLTLLINRTPLSTNKSITYTIGHAASVTDAATNSTDLFTVVQTGNLATDLLSRAEIDVVGLNPAIKFSIAMGSGGTAESMGVTCIALLSRVEQTPLLSSVLATGTVKIYAAGATQSN